MATWPGDAFYVIEWRGEDSSKWQSSMQHPTLEAAQISVGKIITSGNSKGEELRIVRCVEDPTTGNQLNLEIVFYVDLRNGN